MYIYLHMHIYVCAYIQTRIFSQETDKATAGDNETQKAHNIADSNIGNTDNDNNNNTNTARPRDGF